MKNANANKPPVQRRKKYIINSAFQWKHAVMVALLVFFISSLGCILLYGILHQQARLRVANPETYTAETTLVIVFFSLTFAAIVSGIAIVWSLLVTHRICGPVFVINRWLQELQSGRLPNLRSLRNKDEFKDLYETFASTIDALKARKQSELKALNEMLKIAKSSAQGSEANHKEALESMIQNIEALRRDALDVLNIEHEGISSTPVSDQPVASPVFGAVS